MTFYVAAYDTEAIYPWWELGDGSPRAATTYQQAVSYSGTRLDECLDGVRAVAEVHLKHRAPATFFIVGRLAQTAGPRLREILDHDLFDLQSHSSTHENMLAIRDDPAAVRRELVDSKAVVEDLFGREVTGFTAPGGSDQGFLGETTAGGAVGGGLPLRPHPELAAGQPLAGTADAALLVQRRRLSRTAGDLRPRLARQHPHRPALGGGLASGPALGLPGAHARHRPRGLPGLRSRHRARPRRGAAHLFPLLPSLVDPSRRPRRRAGRPAAGPRPPLGPDPGLVRRRVPAPWWPSRSWPIRLRTSPPPPRSHAVVRPQNSSSKPPRGKQDGGARIAMAPTRGRLDSLDRDASTYESSIMQTTAACDLARRARKGATLEEVRRHGHVLTRGRYVGAEPQGDDGEPLEERMASRRT